MGDEVDNLVRVADLKVGDEVEDYGTLTWLDDEGFGVRYVTTHADGWRAPVAVLDAWPAGARVPVVRKPRKQRRTVVIDYPAGRDVPTIGTGVARWDDSVVVSDEVTEVDA